MQVAPESRPHWLTCVDVWGPKPRAVDQPPPAKASGSSAQTAGASALEGGEPRATMDPGDGGDGRGSLPDKV